jgi:hypothetical protein
MATVDLPTVTAALSTVVEYVSGLEARVRQLQVRTAAIAGEHLRDEDVQQEVIRVGDQLRVATPILLQEWIDNAGLPTSPLLVREIRIEEDGSKTLIVAAKGPTP